MTDQTAPVVFVEQDVELTDLTTLVPYPGNPHIGDEAAIGSSIDEHGYYGAIIVQRSSRFILAGEHRWKQLLARDIHEEMCAVVDVDDARAREIVFSDNRTHDLGAYDDAALAAGLSKVPDLSGTGFDATDLAAMTAKAADRMTGSASNPTAPPPAQGLRPIVLPFEIGRYEELTGILPGWRDDVGVDTNAELFLWLCRDRADALAELAEAGWS